MPVAKRKASEAALRRARGRTRKRKIERRKLIRRRVLEARKETRIDRDELARRIEAGRTRLEVFCSCGRAAGYKGSRMCKSCYLADLRDELLTIHNVLPTWRVTAMDLLCNNQDEQEVTSAAHKKRKKARRARGRASA